MAPDASPTRIGRRTALAGLLSSGTTVLSGTAGRAAAAAPELRRGVCLSSWFSNAPRQPLFERDFAQIAKAGFDHVRLGVNPELIGYLSAPAIMLPHPDPARAQWAAVDEAVALATKHRLAVIFDIHPEAQDHERLEKQPWVPDDLVAFVRYVARRYKDYPADQFAIEVLNEPQFYHRAEQYQVLAGRLVDAVRSEMALHTILLGGPFGNSIEGLRVLIPLDDRNIRYVFHCYAPYIVTHQGINSGFEGTEIRAFHGVPYPAARVDPAVNYAPGASSPARARRELNRYVAEDWGPERIRREIAPAAEWAASHGVRILCTEFGVFRAFIDPAARARWIGDVRRTLESFGIGWDIWDYADIFGITIPVGDTVTNPSDHSVMLANPARGTRRFEPELLAALGLKQS